MKRRSSRAAIAAVLLAAALGLNACWTLSVHPLYTADTVVFEPDLVGIWGDPEDPTDETWQFTAAGDQSYRLVIRETPSSPVVDETQDGIYEVHLVELNGYCFLDGYPIAPKSVNQFYETSVIPAHAFVRLHLEGHVLHLAALDTAWLREGLEAGRLVLAHELEGSELVLTASTRELQEFLAAHAEEAFAEEDVLHRLD
jgi:hypothetical protein